MNATMEIVRIRRRDSGAMGLSPLPPGRYFLRPFFSGGSELTFLD
jgi:hypothetical protein